MKIFQLKYLFTLMDNAKECFKGLVLVQILSFIKAFYVLEEKKEKMLAKVTAVDRLSVK